MLNANGDGVFLILTKFHEWHITNYDPLVIAFCRRINVNHLYLLAVFGKYFRYTYDVCFMQKTFSRYSGRFIYNQQNV